MRWKKYRVLMPPFLIIGILLIIFLPDSQKHYSILAVLAFWVVYFIWVLIEEKGKKVVRKIQSKGD